MILADFKDFPRVGRLLGIDWGAKRIGLAVSDDRQEFVFPRAQSTEHKAQIEQIIADEKIAGIVVGLPLRGDGTESETTRAVREFANALPDLPTVFMEENLTSMAAEEYTKEKRKIDSVAAAIILENAIAVMRRK